MGFRVGTGFGPRSGPYGRPGMGTPMIRPILILLALAGLAPHPRMSERLDRLAARLATWETRVPS